MTGCWSTGALTVESLGASRLATEPPRNRVIKGRVDVGRDSPAARLTHSTIAMTISDFEREVKQDCGDSVTLSEYRLIRAVVTSGNPSPSLLGLSSVTVVLLAFWRHERHMKEAPTRQNERGTVSLSDSSSAYNRTHERSARAEGIVT